MRSDRRPHDAKCLAALIFAASAAQCAPAQRETPQSHPRDAQSMREEACRADRRFTFVPAGAFVFGSTHEERDAAYRMAAFASGHDDAERARAESVLRARRFFDFEPTRARVEMSSYCLARRPVTQAEYGEFVRATGHRAPTMDPPTWQSQGYLVHPFDEVARYVWNGPAPRESEREWPVVLVSVDDAMAYARWAGAHDGRVYDLPSREEWERASRGDDGALYPWGDEWRDDAINFDGAHIGHPEAVATHPLARGPFGNDDMLGNVFEWTRTHDATRWVLKGCAFDDVPGFCRSAYEHRRVSTARHILISFRLVWR